MACHAQHREAYQDSYIRGMGQGTLRPLGTFVFFRGNSPVIVTGKTAPGVSRPRALMRSRILDYDN
jgi:hypothetical protein